MTVVFDAVVFVCYNIVLSCPLIASHVENLSDMYSLVYTVNIRKITTLLFQQIRYTFFSQTLPKGTKPNHLRPKPQKNIKQKYLKRWTTPRKENRKHVQQYWHTERAHGLVEMSKPVGNETNYRAKQNNMKTDQRHPQKKLEFTKLRVRVRAGVPQQWFLGPRGVKSYPPMICLLYTSPSPRD